MNDPHRFKTAVVHRRWGKTEMAVRWLVKQARDCKLPRPQCFFLGCTLRSVEVVAWGMLQDACPDNTKFNQSRLTATLPNGAKVSLIGSWNFTTHRGVYADALVIDEVDLIPPSAFNAVFRPALSDRKGNAMFIGTPLGKGHLWQRLQASNLSKLWASWHIPVTDTNIIDADERADLEATMPKADWLREYMVDFDAASPGSYYGNQIDQARLGQVEIREDLPVTAAWHLGDTDSIVVTFWQEHGGFLHCIDALWEQQTSMGEVAELIEKKDYRVDLHRVSGNESHKPGGRIHVAKQAGVKLLPAKKLSLIERIYATKPLLDRVKFDEERCGDVIEGLRQYRAEYDEVKRVFSSSPVADWSQEFAGSVEAYATSHNPLRTDWSKAIEYPEDRAA